MNTYKKINIKHATIADKIYVKESDIEDLDSFIQAYTYLIGDEILFTYEHDEENNRIVLDRVLHNTNSFPYNYGYLPDTLSPDGDPIDIIVLGDYELLPGSWVKCKVIGGIETTDEKGRDDKIIVVLDDKLDRRSKYINSLNDINKVDLDNIVYFLSHYKDNEINKHSINWHWVKGHDGNKFNEQADLLARKFIQKNT